MMVRTNGMPVLQELKSDWLLKAGVQLFLKREDLIHPVISGNKWRKLYYNLEQARKDGFNQLLTFGGAFSNHLHATACAAALTGLKSIGIVRGEFTLPLNSTLSFAREKGMILDYVNRTEYRNKENLLPALKDKYGSFYNLPEGGSNCLAIKGCAEMVDTEISGMDILAVPVGTGGTMAGILSAMPPSCRVLGFAALKGNFLTGEVNNLLLRCHIDPKCQWDIIDTFHFGGYARLPEELLTFIREFRDEHHVLLDPVYTCKMLYGLKQMIDSGHFRRGTRLCAIHTGGLQGWAGMKERYGLIV